MDGRTQLLQWAQSLTRGYDDVHITDLTSRSWADGMAFCAILHEKGYINVWDFADFEPTNAYTNLKFAFDTAMSKMGIPATLQVTEMGSESPLVDQKLVLYLAEWHRRLEDRAVDVDSLKQPLPAANSATSKMMVTPRGDEEDDDEDSNDNGTRGRFATLIDSSDFLKQPAPKVGRPPVPSLSPRPGSLGGSSSSTMPSVPSRSSGVGALPSPPHSPRAAQGKSPLSPPLPPSKGSSIRGPRPPTRPGVDSGGIGSPSVGSRYEDDRSANASPMVMHSPRTKPSGSIDETSAPRSPRQAAASTDDGWRHESGERSPRWSEAQQSVSSDKVQGLQMGMSRSSSRAEHVVPNSPAAKVQSKTAAAAAPSKLHASGDHMGGAPAPRAAPLPPVPLPRKSAVDSPKPPPRGSPRGDADNAVSTPKSPRAGPVEPPPRSPRGDGDAVSTPKSPRAAGDAPPRSPIAPARPDSSAAAAGADGPKSPRKPMAGAVQLFGGEIKALDLKGKAAATPPSESKTSPRSDKPLPDPKAKSKDAAPLVESPKKKGSLFPPLVRIRLAGGITCIELVPGDDVDGVCSSIEALELPRPHALVAVTPDMGTIAVLPSDMDLTEVQQKYPDCSLFEMSADKRQWKAQRARYFAPPPVIEETAPKKRVFAVEVQLPGRPLEVIKVLLTEADTGATMVSKIWRKLREDETQKGSLILMEKGCRDYYIGENEYPWAEVERRGTQAFRAVFRNAARDDAFSVNLVKLLAECAEPPMKPLECTATTTASELLGKIGAPAGTHLLLVVTDLPERPLRPSEVLFESACMFHPEDYFFALAPAPVTK